MVLNPFTSEPEADYNNVIRDRYARVLVSVSALIMFVALVIWCAPARLNTPLAL